MDQIESSYIAPDVASLVNEWKEGGDSGSPARVNALNDVLAWKRGFISGFYGWPSDGKGSMVNFLYALKAKYDGWKFCMFKQEDMSSARVDGKLKMTANDIYNELVWCYTGKTPFKNFAIRHKVKQLGLEEYLEALEFIQSKFFVVYPKDRKFKTIMDEFLFMYEHYGIDGFLIDPWKSVILEEGERTDLSLNNAFVSQKEFSIKTNTIVNNIAHPKNMTEVREKGKNGDKGAYKIVDQYMIAGGAAWDNNMDSQYSIYRPERHLSPNDTKVHFYNLKQRKAEIVGANRGVYDKIKFDPLTKQFYFDGINPMNGEVIGDKKQFSAILDFSVPKVEQNVDPDSLPF